MPNKRYLAGRRFEWKVKKDLEKEDYLVMRSSASKGLFDLIAIKTHPSFNYLSIEFWQLKKGITHNQASDLVRKIQKQILGDRYFPIFTENFGNKFKNCIDLFFQGGAITDKYNDPKTGGKISFGVIYTLPKKKKLDKRKKIV
jgi:hypothetical protein